MTQTRAIAGIVGLLFSVISMTDGLAGQGNAAVADLIVPHESWSCGLPDGIPRPEGGTLVFEAEMKLDRVADIGRTPACCVPDARSPPPLPPADRASVHARRDSYQP